jgi:large subunit ribosomal protein L21
MYAIVKTGGKQYKVAEGDVLDVEKLNAQPGDEVTLDVLMLNDGTKVTVEPAALEGAKITAKVIDQHRGDKVVVFKFHKRKRYHRTRGHRQSLTKIEVTSIQG